MMPMRDNLQSIISDEVIKTLEKLAFLFGMPDDDREAGDFSDKIVGSATFKGPFDGRLALALSRDALPELAGNMLGADDPETIDESQCRDALKETVNIVCGNVLPVLGGKSAVFDVAPPEIAREGIDAPDGGWGEPAAVVCLGFDEGQCDIYLYLEGDLSSLSDL